MGIVNEIIDRKAAFGHDDRYVIGDLFQPMDEGKDFVSGDNNYVWFYLIGRVVKPKVIAEMGSRFGYSLKCFVEGAGHRAEAFTVRSFDAECDGIQTLSIMEDYFKNVLKVADFSITKADTLTLTTLGLDGQCDLVMVDGMHTVEGCLNECRLAWQALKPGGVMVVDDYFDPLPPVGLDLFCKESGATYSVIPSFRGIAILLKPE